VQRLALKRYLDEELVIAPYASAMALMVLPDLACNNLQRMVDESFSGSYGFYEAIDYTPFRLNTENKKEIIRSFMAHHQGMTFLSFSYVLNNQPMQQRFILDPLFQSALLLLQERTPKPTIAFLQMPSIKQLKDKSHSLKTSQRTFTTPNTSSPQVQLLSNGRYHVMLTQAGGGYSRWNNIMLTRWREDSTCDHWGLFCYIRDVDQNKLFSTAYQPTKHKAENFRATLTEARVVFNLSQNKFDVNTEIVVSHEDDIELRRVRIHNQTNKKRLLEFTTFFEIVLAPEDTDLAQPTFSNLFVETELLTQQNTILAMRRDADKSKPAPCLFHLLNIHSKKRYVLSFETDRAKFIGRCGTPRQPQALVMNNNPLTNTAGCVLDPIASIQCKITLDPGELIIFDVITGITESKSSTTSLVQKYQDRRFANRIFGLASAHSQVLLHHLNMSEVDAHLYERMASAIIYCNRSRRADPRIIMKNRRSQSALWAYSISGDLPIVLLHIMDIQNIELARQVIQAQAYWRLKGLEVDIVILSAEHTSYRQPLKDAITNLISTNQTNPTAHSGKLFFCMIEQMPAEDVILLESVARIVLSDQRGDLKMHLYRKRVNHSSIPLLKPSRIIPKYNAVRLKQPSDLLFFNGYGGFTNGGNEYFIHLSENQTTPAPWINILANPHFGTTVSESNQGYTWVENSHEFRLTSWDNDPLQDTSGEAFYLRNEDNGLIWSPMPLPCRGKGDYQVRHGFGYSTFEHIENDIHTLLTVYVAADAPIKFVKIQITNQSQQLQRLSAVGFVTWILGDLRIKNFMHIATELSDSGAILAQNHYNADFGQRTAFFQAVTSKLNVIKRSYTGDRMEFLGRNGSLQMPSALRYQSLSNKVGAGLDPCAAIQLTFDLPPGETRDVIFMLGAGENKTEAETLLSNYHSLIAAKNAFKNVQQCWDDKINILRINTPDQSFNLLANGWLLYQILSSRLWGRTGYYQSSGAFGFRDQLQDAMSLTKVAPKLFRQQLILCASHQYEEGDVQHWWHPPLNRGVRTRCSDDYLWFPYALCHYIQTTGDKNILEEKTPFLIGRLLKPDEESNYELPNIGNETFSLYEHAVRAIKYGLRFGSRGLPLMGSGDWNDGMNLVGIKGKGESIWLGFFLYNVLTEFVPIASEHSDTSFASQCEEAANTLKQQLETHGWDGAWYLRAYFDNGQPLGSKNNEECCIDAIAQSWSVISKAAPLERAKEALNHLKKYLVDEEYNIIKLLAPPFDTSTPSPGYIQAYVPGVRENGGQYTHAAVWSVMAFALLGETNTAWQLFNMINPVNHGRNEKEISLYKIEPYVTAGDVYSISPHTGRGGWSWYSGSAGWMYRLMIETLLGIQLEAGEYLILSPSMPDEWLHFEAEYHFNTAKYKIKVERVNENNGLFLDNILQNDHRIALKDDGQVHEVYCKII
ncbi:MAG: cyclic beta 1-2 glucan synthetase, partial [Gammaproteobacteria bacterium]|nr:cyclic beta 1-2 glucan synthetase [Gammaproteobacteria bacterium]